FLSFFFQAEDGIRDFHVTGVQTCALPILGLSVTVRKNDIETVEQTRDRSLDLTVYAGQSRGSASTSDFSEEALRQTVEAAWHIRSEERRVGKEGRSRGWPDGYETTSGDRV